MVRIAARQSGVRMAVLLAALGLAPFGMMRLGAQVVSSAPVQARPPITTPPAAPVPAAVPATNPATNPAWPVNEAPAPAVVQWDSHGLRISAKNASLRQILTEVSSRIGAKLEGMGADERVFGEYGPGEAKEVLADLLHGSAYNVMLIGDQGQGTPRQIVLSARGAVGGTQTHGAQPGQNNSEDDSDTVEDTPVQVQQPPLPRPPMNPQPNQGPPQ
jgi:hypothetical protein